MKHINTLRAHLGNFWWYSGKQLHLHSSIALAGFPFLLSREVENVCQRKNGDHLRLRPWNSDQMMIIWDSNYQTRSRTWTYRPSFWRKHNIRNAVKMESSRTDIHGRKILCFWTNIIWRMENDLGSFIIGFVINSREVIIRVRHVHIITMRICNRFQLHGGDEVRIRIGLVSDFWEKGTLTYVRTLTYVCSVCWWFGKNRLTGKSKSKQYTGRHHLN